MKNQSFLDTIKSAITSLFKSAPSNEVSQNISQPDFKGGVTPPSNEPGFSDAPNTAIKKLDKLEPEPKLTVNQLIIDQLHTNPLSIRTIMNPSEEMQYIATSADPRALNFIENPSDKLVVATITESPSVLKYLDEAPSDDLLIKCLNNNTEVFKYIEHPSAQIIDKAITNDGNLIQFIDNPSSELELSAVRSDPAAIRHIKNSSEDLQIEAVKQDKHTIEYIQNPVTDIMGKAGWIVYLPESKFGLTRIPDTLKLEILKEPNYEDYPICLE